MPDDQTLDQAVAEQTSDESFGEGFAETDKPAADKAGDEAQKPEEKAPAESGQEKPDGESKPEADKAPVEQKTAQERLEELAKTREKPAPVEAPAPAPAAEPEKKPEQPASASDKWLADLLKLPEVANAKIGVEGKETTVEEFAKEYPEAVQAPVAIAKVMIEKAVGQIQAQAMAQIQAMSAKLGNMEFWDGIHQAHSDGRKIAASKEFKEWVGKQSPLTQALLGSENVADGVAVLDAYKESLAKASKESKDKEALKRKENRDALHSETLRGRGGLASESNKDQDDFDAGFNNGKK